MERRWQYIAGGYPRRTFAGLMALYESNYARLLALVPHLHTIAVIGSDHAAGIAAGVAAGIVSQVDGALDLHLAVLERTPYTTIVLLTYHLGHEGQGVAEPNARLRVYHDARLVEVLSCRGARGSDARAPSALMARWHANLFLEKWLNYCLRQGHRFHPGARAPVPAGVLSDA